MTSVMRATFAVLAAGIFAGLAVVSAWPQSAPAQTASPNGAKVYCVNLKDGQEVTSPFLVHSDSQARASLRPAWKKPNTGHHHLLIDSALSGDELKQPIAMDDTHRHFGNGQTEAMITLPPGQH